MIDDLQYYRSFRFALSFYKSKRYLLNRKTKYADKDLHHILGSYSGRKTTDYLIVPLEHNFHLDKVHKNLPRYFRLFIAPAILQLADYGKEDLLLGIKEMAFINKVAKMETITPQNTITIIETIRFAEVNISALEKRQTLIGVPNVL